MLHPSCLHELKADLMADNEGHCPVNMLRWISPLMGVWQLGLGVVGWKVTLANWHVLGVPHITHMLAPPFIHSWDSDKGDLTTLTPDQHRIWTIVDFGQLDSTWQADPRNRDRDADRQRRMRGRFVGLLLFVVVASMVFHDVWQSHARFCDFRCQNCYYLFRMIVQQPVLTE